VIKIGIICYGRTGGSGEANRQFFLQFLIATTFGALKYLSGQCSMSSRVAEFVSPNYLQHGYVG
jgi:hypothetical protein